jgi:hypothetical protein
LLAPESEAAEEGFKRVGGQKGQSYSVAR